MTRNALYLLGIVATIILGTVLFVNLCGGCLMESYSDGVDAEPHQPSPVQVPSDTYPFTIKDSSFTIQVDDNFDFGISNPSFIMPISGPLKQGINELKNHLASHPEKVLEITGYYISTEENNTSYANLGLARANSVKNQLVLSGVKETQIEVASQLDENLVQQEGTFFGAVSYSLSQQSTEEDEP